MVSEPGDRVRLNAELFKDELEKGIDMNEDGSLR